MRRIPSFFLAAGLFACSPDDNGSSATTGPQELCAKDARVQTFGSGLEGTAGDGSIKVTFVAADPSPLSKGANSFTVRIADGSGKPIDGVTLKVTPYMPDHRHGSSIVPQVMPKGDGLYAVTLVEIFMPGVWRITFDVKRSETLSSSVEFYFCVEG